MPAPAGNQNGLKLKDPDIRQEAYKQFCAWIARGKSPRSFTFEKDEFKCTGQTIDSYIKDNPIEFPPIHKNFAHCQGYAHWEQVVEDSAIGLNKEANTASLQMLMRNKYDWDKQEKQQQPQPSEQVQFELSKAKELNGQDPLKPEASRLSQECDS